MSNSYLDEIAAATDDTVRNAASDVVSRVRESVSAVVEYEFLRRHTRQELPVLSEHGGGSFAERIERLCDGQSQHETLSL